MVGGFDGLVRDRRDPALDQRAGEVLVGGDMEVGEEDEPFPEPAVLRRHGLLHLEQELDVAPDVFDGHDLDALGLVRRVREGAALPRALLHEHVVSALNQLASTGRRQRDAVLVGLDLFGDADPHLEPRNLTFRGLLAFRTLGTFSLHTRVIFRSRLKTEGGKRPAPGSCPDGSRLREAVNQPAAGRACRRRTPRRRTTGRRRAPGPCARAAGLRRPRASRRRPPLRAPRATPELPGRPARPP